MRKIRFYQQDGRIHDEQELTHDSLYGAMGMMARCYLRDDNIHEGFVCFQTDIGNETDEKENGSIFYLWTWAHLDTESHSLVGDGEEKYDQHYEAIDYLEVERVDAILYSNPRWGGLLYNHFFIDTRPYFSFDEVQHIFKKVWCSGYEEHWYRNVWNILHRKNMTRYTTESERCEVLLCAVAVSLIYEDFCKVYREEIPSYDYLDELIDDISEFTLGQLYGERHPGEIIESCSEAIFFLGNELRDRIVDTIKSEMNDLDILAHLICTAQSVYVVDETGDEIDFEIANFGDYKKAVKLFQDSYFESADYDEQEAFYWIYENMPLTGSFY